MAIEVKVTAATLEIRTAKLTKALLKQFKKVSPFPSEWLDANGNENLEYVVGWFHGSVLGDEFTKYALLTNNKGDYYLYHHVSSYVLKHRKQIYIG